MNFWTSSDRVLEKENMERQSDLIHILWGYHSDRLNNGHPFGLANSIQSENPDSDHFQGPRYLANDVNRRGIIELDLVDSMRQGIAGSPITTISNSVTASMWDSLNHINNVSHTSQDQKYDEFIHDPDLSILRNEMDEHGRGIHSFRGSTTVHAGIQVGLGTITFFSGLQYPLPKDHPFDAPRLARIMAKTTDIKLSLWNMQMTMYKMGIINDPQGKLIQGSSSLGMPSQILKGHCIKNAIGCPAMHPIGPRLKEILKRHGLYSDTFENNEQDSAIKMISRAVQNYFNQQIDTLLSSLTTEEQIRHIRKTDLDILKGNHPTDTPDPALT